MASAMTVPTPRVAAVPRGSCWTGWVGLWPMGGHGVFQDATRASDRLVCGAGEATAQLKDIAVPRPSPVAGYVMTLRDRDRNSRVGEPRATATNLVAGFDHRPLLGCCRDHDGHPSPGM
jgi:hypothetical protein